MLLEHEESHVEPAREWVSMTLVCLILGEGG
jgi:hypothetical protein